MPFPFELDPSQLAAIESAFKKASSVLSAPAQSAPPTSNGYIIAPGKGSLNKGGVKKLIDSGELGADLTPGEKLIITEEGYSPTVYHREGDIPTIGFGLTWRRPGPNKEWARDERERLTLTQTPYPDPKTAFKDARDFINSDVIKTKLIPTLGADTYKSLTPEQQGALQSIVYQQGNLRPSISKLIKEKPPGWQNKVAESILKLSPADSPLVNRRQAEAALWRSSTPTQNIDKSAIIKLLLDRAKNRKVIP